MIPEHVGARARTRSRPWLALALLGAALGPATAARAQTSIGEPLAAGDQLVFFFDTRSPRVTFVNVANPAAEAVVLEILIPAAGVRDAIEVGALANRVIDPTALAPGVRGLLVVTPIVAAEDHTPVVPPALLLGNYTIANVELGAAFGGNALARRAVGNGAFAPAGSVVDGTAIRYQLVSPASLAIPVYYDPQTLGPPEQDGNRLQLAAFLDEYDGDYFPAPVPGSVEARFLDRDGAEVAVRTVPLEGGLLDTDLETLAGTPLTSSGKVFLTFLPANGATGNFLGLFSQALGTFGAGGVLPELALPSGS